MPVYSGYGMVDTVNKDPSFSLLPQTEPEKGELTTVEVEEKEKGDFCRGGGREKTGITRHFWRL